MTATILFRAILRRWYVAAVCLVLVAWACMVLMGMGRTYWTQSQVVFVEPGVGSVTNVNDGVAPSLINFAGIVQRKVAYEGDAVELPSTNSTLYGSGIRNGYSISLPNTGNQWAVSFSKPMLAIQVTGSTPEEVRRTLAAVLAHVERAAAGLQSDSSAAPETYIGVEASPAAPDIIDVGGTPVGRQKGLAAVIGVGAVLSGCTAYGTDGLVTWWRRRRHGRQPA